MIDTDKYEGHTEGEWTVGARKGAMTVKDSNGEEIAATNSYPIARLMADAPLLLAEVKRLREAIEQLTVKVEGMSTGYRKTIVKALREMIE